MRKHLPDIGLSLVLYLILVLRYGYEFGRSDQVEFLPYALFINDNTLYPFDFFVRGISSLIPNERTFTVYFLSIFREYLEPSCFVLHFLSSIVLLYSLLKFCEKIIQSKSIAFIAVLTSLLFLYNYTIGLNELWCNNFQSGLIANALAACALNYLSSSRLIRAFVLLCVSTLFQPLEGLQAAMLAMAWMAYYIFQIRDKIYIKQSLIAFCMYIGIAIPYILWIKTVNSNAGDAVSSTEFFTILFRFRHPHHYIPSAFAFWQYPLMLILILIACVRFWKSNPEIIIMIFCAILFALVYSIGVEVFESATVASLQAFKIFQWVKWFGVIALVDFIAKKVPFSSKLENKLTSVSLVLVLVLIAILGSPLKSQLPYFVHFDFGKQTDQDPLLQACEEAGRLTPKNAVFIQPFGVCELKYYGKVSSYVDFKANVRQNRFSAEWYNRIKTIYGIAYQKGKSGYSLEPEADQNFGDILKKVPLLKEKGITHVLTFAQAFVPENCSVLYTNKQWKIVQLP